MKSAIWKAVGVVIIGIALGFAFGWFSRGSRDTQMPTVLKEVREDNPQLSLINPILYVETTEAKDHDQPFDDQVTNYVNQAKDNAQANDISVYYRDLNSGHWIGVNEDDKYEPSSMLKVLTMISYLNAAESGNQNILNQQFYYTGKGDPGQYYKPTTVLPAGNYSASDLIKRMVTESDNEAATLLLNAHNDAFVSTYQTLELPGIPSTDTPIDYMSPKEYSVIFRTLYNASYLSQELSQQALDLLTYTTFTKGLVAGVPQGTVVAHKFGEHTSLEMDGQIASRELHDCGIVYYPGAPYFLCVMTKGSDFPTLEKIIQDISKLTYSYTQQHNAPAK